MIFIFSIYFLVLFINNIILALQDIFSQQEKKKYNFAKLFIITSVVFYIFFHLFSFWV